MKLKLSLIVLFLSHFTFASDFSGNVKFYGINRDLIGNYDNQINYQLSSKFQYNKEVISNLKFELAYEVLMDHAKPIIHTEPEPNYRIKDLNIYLHNERPNSNYKTIVSQNLNRLNLNSSFEKFDLSLGRMPVAFGSAKSINPTDVLAPFSLATLDKEEKIGLDALIIKSSINSTSLVEAGFVMGHDLESKKNAYYLRPKLNFNEFDMAITLMHFKDKNLLGFDLQHPIKDAGFWFEASFTDVNQRGLNDFLRFTSGLDYKFQNTLYLAGEYHYNGAAINNLSLSPFDFIYLKNKHYFIITSSYEFTPLLTGSLQSYYGAKDQSSLSSLKLEYNMIENAYLNLGSYRSIGDDQRSEFGRYGQVYYLACRYYY